MTRDYAKPSTTKKTNAPKRGKKPKAKSGASSSKPKKTESASGNKSLHIVLISLILGGFGFSLYKLAQVKGDIPDVTVNDTENQTKPTVEATPKPAQEKPEARFQFYDLLPKSEVETDTVDAYTFKEKGADEEYSYILQTGSFRSAQDAERQKATIAFQGLKARIRAATNAQGSTWHRVETGPFASRSEMNAALDKLYAINVQPLVKKSKK